MDTGINTGDLIGFHGFLSLNMCLFRIDGLSLSYLRGNNHRNLTARYRLLKYNIVLKTTFYLFKTSYSGFVCVLI